MSSAVSVVDTPGAVALRSADFDAVVTTVSLSNDCRSVASSACDRDVAASSVKKTAQVVPQSTPRRALRW